MAVTPFKSSDNFNMAGFNEKITEADNTYVAKTGDSMSGALSMGNNKITDVASPVNDGDVATKKYVDEKDYNYLSDFNIPETINNCHLGLNSSNVFGTATVKNYIGYSIVIANVTRTADSASIGLTKSDYSRIMPGFYSQGNSSSIVISSGSITSSSYVYATFDINGVNIPVSKSGISKYLFPFNLI